MEEPSNQPVQRIDDTSDGYTGDATTNSLEVIQLRKALDEALKENACLKAIINQGNSAATATKNRVKCYLLEAFPLEVRNMIYAHLLCSQILSQALSVHDSYEVEQLWDSQKYGLSPQILRTCRQIYVEASVVLYGWNTYIVDFRYNLITPILRTRNFGGVDIRPPHATKKHRCMVIANLDIPVLKKVRRWKIIPLAGHAKPYRYTPCGLALFCHQITSSPPPTSIEVILDLRCVVKEKDVKCFQAFEDEVRHLGLLRKVGRFEVDSMPVEDVGSPCYDETVNVAWEMEDDLKGLIEGDSPVDSLHQMYQNLKIYCDLSRLVYPWDSGVLGCNNTLFKTCRRKILQRLEPQYQRIMAASVALTDFVKSEKHDQGMFALPATKSNCKFGEAFILAEDFATSFLPELRWKERASNWETLCSNAKNAQKNPCHVQLELARKSVAWGDITSGLSSYRAAVNELDTKFWTYERLGWGYLNSTDSKSQNVETSILRHGDAMRRSIGNLTSLT